MTDTQVAPTAPAAQPVKRAATAITGAKKVKSSSATEKKPASHPPVAKMITDAIAQLNDKSGSSLLAIKKVIGESHKVDLEKLAPHLKRALKKGVETGKLTQPKGKGVGGSFKLAAKAKPVKEAKTPAAAAAATTTKSAKKAATPKAKQVKPKTAVKKSPKKAASLKTKAVASKKAPVKAAKTPKVKLPKTMKAKPKAAPKKAAPKQK